MYTNLNTHNSVNPKGVSGMPAKLVMLGSVNGGKEQNKLF